MLDRVRLQVREDSAEKPWKDVGHHASHKTVPVSSSALPLPSGAATSAKQLPDDHNVTISNPTTNPETGLAKEVKQDDVITALVLLLTELGEKTEPANTQKVALEPTGTPITTERTLTNADTSYKLPSSELASRKTLIVTNNDDTTVYLGQTGVINSASSPAVGIPLEAGKTIMIDSSTGWYAQCHSAGKKLTITEMA